MAPKPKKDAQPVVQADDFSQEVVLLSTVHSAQLRLGLLATPDRLSPELLTDVGAVPQLHVELHHNSQAPATAAFTAISADFPAAISLEHKFRHKKGIDIIDRLINGSFEIRICNSQSKAALAVAHVDLLPFGLGSNVIEDVALPLQPTTTDEPFKVLPGSTVSVSIRLMHQPAPILAATTSAVSANQQSSGTACSSGSTSAGGAAAAAACGQPQLEPLQLLAAEDASSCNVLEFAPVSACPLPPQLTTILAALNGSMSLSLGLHLPKSSPGSKAPAAVQCSGGTFVKDHVAWSRSSRVHLSPAAVQALKDLLELGQPLLLEVGRYTVASSPADTISDPAFGSYHAMLQLDCAAEQLQEPGAVTAAGPAAAVECISWALQQGWISAPCLPSYTMPAGRAKVIEEAPPPPADTSQPPSCAWLAAGTKFMVQLRLARPLYPPWQPPSRPSKQLSSLIPVQLPLPPPPAPTAAEQFRHKVQALAEELAVKYADACSSTGSSKQALVFELNNSGKYLALKDDLKQLVLKVVHERFKGLPSAAQALQLHSDLYVYLTDELKKAMAAANKAAQQSTELLQPNAAQASTSSISTSSNSDAAVKLLQLATECEISGDVQRGHTLHQRRLVLLQSADAWYQYGTFCMRSKCHIRADAAFREALSRVQHHIPAAAALVCLGLAQAAAASADGTVGVMAALEGAEVLGHSLKDAAAAAAVDDGAVPLAWALLALLYRMQGKPKEAQARSCHQEVVRQSKAAVGTSSSSTCGSAETGNNFNANYADTAAANGYLAAAELAVQLRLPGLAVQLLELAAGVRDPAGQLGWRMKLVSTAVAQQSGDTTKAMQLVKELSGHAAAAGTDTDKTLVQILLADLQYEASHLGLAKQHYRRALQKDPYMCPTQLYLRLGDCFMASKDAGIAADVYTACLEAPAAPAAPAEGTTHAAGKPMVGFVADAGATPIDGRCASMWLGLGVAYLRTADFKSAELALSQANVCDPENPLVWAHLALLSLLKGREQDADQALRQAQRHGLAQQELLVELADKYQELQRFGTAAGLLGQATVVCDTVPVRCKLAAVLLAQRDYSGCHQQLTAAAALSVDSEEDRQLLSNILAKLQVAWPHL